MDNEVSILMSSGGGTTYVFTTAPTYDEAAAICEGYGWEFVDENNFVWELSIETY